MAGSQHQWSDSVPTRLLIALQHLEYLFNEIWWSSSAATRGCCYRFLHGEPQERKDTVEVLQPLTRLAGDYEKTLFFDRLGMNTPSSVFHALLSLHLGAVKTVLRDIFDDLKEIGIANQRDLDSDPLIWANERATELVEARRQELILWITTACDREAEAAKHNVQDLDGWRAPRFLCMQPIRKQSYDAATAWDRMSSEETATSLKSLADSYLFTLNKALWKARGEAAVKRARERQPKRAAETKPFVSDNMPLDMRLRRLALSLEKSLAEEAAHGSLPANKWDFRLSTDLRSVTFKGSSLPVTITQGRMLKALCDAHSSGVPCMSDRALASAAGSKTSQVRGIFRRSPLFKTVIVRASPGVYRLDL